jgi:uncharacterized protein
MSKNKQVSKKQAAKNRFTLISVVIVLIAFVSYFVLSNLLVNKEQVNQEVDKVPEQKTIYSFTKEGELSFLGAKGEVISQLDLEVADDDEQRQRGLMFRDKMDENQGMIFLFDKEAPQAFWMHNTILSLDIIYVNASMEIVKIAKNAKPFDDSSIPSVKPAKYVVEVNGGYTQRHNVNEGNKIVWRRL